MSLFGISSLMCNAVVFYHKSKISLNKFGLAFFESKESQPTEYQFSVQKGIIIYLNTI